MANRLDILGTHDGGHAALTTCPRNVAENLGNKDLVLASGANTHNPDLGVTHVVDYRAAGLCCRFAPKMAGILKLNVSSATSR